MGQYDPRPYQLDLTQYPHIVTKEIPDLGAWSEPARFCALSRLVGTGALVPGRIRERRWCSLEDVDGNRYIDFSAASMSRPWALPSEDFGYRLHPMRSA